MRPTFIVLLIMIVLGGFVALGHAVGRRGVPVTQPILFNHTVHLNEAGLQCQQCHTDAATDRFAGLPGKASCLDCHDIDEEAGTDPEKDKLFAYDETDDDIPWVRVAILRPDVFFSHRRHVTGGGLDCLECHRDQPQLTQPPPTTRLVMRMTDCIACHDSKGVTHDCLACHR